MASERRGRGSPTQPRGQFGMGNNALLAIPKINQNSLQRFMPRLFGKLEQQSSYVQIRSGILQNVALIEFQALMQG